MASGCVVKAHLLIVADPTWQQLKEKGKALRVNAVAATTLRARLVQWNCYKKFCNKFRLPYIPCSSQRLSIYASYLASYMCYSSIITYLQAVVFYHKVNGYDPPSSSSPVMKLTMEGIKRTGKRSSRKRDPVRVSHLKRMYSSLNLKSDHDLLFWGMCLFLFRTLLRVSHVVESNHTVLVNDVKFKNWGMLIKYTSVAQRLTNLDRKP